MFEVKRGTCQSLSRVGLFATSWTAALQAPLSMEFSSIAGSHTPLQGIFSTEGRTKVSSSPLAALTL